MTTIDEGEAIIIGGFIGIGNYSESSYLLTCKNRNCTFSTLSLALKTPRWGFVAIPLPNDAECQIEAGLD